ncbi:hypothetical protein ES707_13557 [subsurface metagenome]
MDTKVNCMKQDRVIEILGKAASGVVTLDDEFHEAVEIGQKAVILLTQDNSHRLDRQSQKLLLGVSEDAENNKG